VFHDSHSDACKSDLGNSGPVCNAEYVLVSVLLIPSPQYRINERPDRRGYNDGPPVSICSSKGCQKSQAKFFDRPNVHKSLDRLAAKPGGPKRHAPNEKTPRRHTVTGAFFFISRKLSLCQLNILWLRLLLHLLLEVGDDLEESLERLRLNSGLQLDALRDGSC
jgi:hypothetical protein